MAILCAATMLMMGLTFAWGWSYLAAHPGLIAEPARPALPAGARRALLGGLVYLIAIAVAFLSPRSHSRSTLPTTWYALRVPAACTECDFRD